MSGIPIRPGSQGSSSSRPLSTWSTESAGSKDSALKSLKSRFSLSKSRTKRRSGNSAFSNSHEDELHITTSASNSVADPFARTDDSLLHTRYRRPLSTSNASAHSSPSLGSSSNSSGYMNRSASIQHVFPRQEDQQRPATAGLANGRSVSFSSLQNVSASASSSSSKLLQPAIQSIPPSPKALTHGNSPPPAAHRLPISSNAYNGLRHRQLSDSSVSSNLRHVASPESPTLVTGSPIPEAQSADLPDSYIKEEEGEKEDRYDAHEEKHDSRDLDWLHLQQQHHRRSPLDELVQDLGGEPREGPGSDGTASNVDPLERTPHASPLINHYRSPPLEALSEVDPAIEAGEFDNEGVDEAHKKLRDSLMLPSAWSNTNSARSSRAEGVLAADTEDSTGESDAQTQPRSSSDSFGNVSRETQEPLAQATSAIDVSTSTDASRRHSAQDFSRGQLPQPRPESKTSRDCQPSLTPKTSRRWSIVEMEQAYSRMRDLFASNASFNKSFQDSSLGQQSSLSVADFEGALATPRPSLEEGDWDRSLAQEIEREPVTPEPMHSDGPATGTETPLGPAFSDVHDRASEYAPDLPGGFPAEASYTSEMRDEVGPLRHQKRSSSPQTFVTSLSDDGRRTPAEPLPPTPTGRPKHLYLVKSASSSALATPVRSPSHLPIPGSARSMTTVNDDGWATPRSSFSPLRDDPSTTSSADHVLAWSRSIDPTVEPQASSLLLRSRPSRSSTSDRDDWTIGSRSRGTTPTEADAPFGDALGALSKSRRRHFGSSQSKHDESVSSVATNTLSEFRTMDKLELFLKFSQTKAEHEALKKKSAMEREALFDALSETRSTLYDTRRQRDQLLKRVQSQEPNTEQVERISGLLRSKTLWQERAQSAAAELDRLRGMFDESQIREEESSHANSVLKAKVATLASQLKEAEAKLAKALDVHQKVLDQLPGPTSEDDKEDTATIPMQSTPPRSRSTPDANNQPTSSKSSGIPQSSSYTRLPTPSRITSPRMRHQSTAGSLVDYDRLQKSNGPSTPLQATKMHLSSPDVSLSESVSAQPSRIGKPKTALPRYRTMSNNSTRSTISTSALNNSSMRSDSPVSQSAYADQGPGRPHGLFDLQEDSQVGLNSEDMAFLKNLDS